MIKRIKEELELTLVRYQAGYDNIPELKDVMESDTKDIEQIIFDYCNTGDLVQLDSDLRNLDTLVREEFYSTFEMISEMQEARAAVNDFLGA